MIEDLLKSKFGDFKRTDAGDYRVCCPFCGEINFKLYVSLRVGTIHCFHCEKKGPVASLVKGNFKLSEVRKIRRPKFTDMPEILPITSSFGSRKIWRYARSRLTEKEIYQHRLGFIDREEYQDRLIMPVTRDFRVSYFQARATWRGAKAKYRNPKRSEVFYGKSEVVFNLDWAREDLGLCVICEGIFSAIAIPSRAGVAILGKTLSPVQEMLLLEKLFNEYIILLDPGAEEEALTMLERLMMCGANVKLGLLDRGDPADVSRSELEKALKEAVALSFSELFSLKMSLKLEKSDA